jgi:antitoxin ParD1/3/4
MGKATLNVSLTDQLLSFVEGEVASGQYGSASEVVREGLRLLQREKAEHAEKLAALREAVQASYDDLAAGRFSDKSVEDIFAEVRARRGR